MSNISSANSEDCSAIVFYGIQPSPKAAATFYEMAVKWFSELGHSPDKAGARGLGHGGKLASFASVNAKLQKLGFDAVIDFDVVSTTPGAVTWGHDYYMTATYNGGPERLYALVVARSSVATLSSMLALARTMVQCLNPEYGIGYTREHRLGPDLYAIGINHTGGAVLSGEAYEEACNVSRWCDTGMVKRVYRDGLLRDVYPWNFVTGSQLGRAVGAVSLEQWIRQDARRGTLKPFPDTVSLWEVAEENISIVRQALRDAGAIFDWRKYS